MKVAPKIGLIVDFSIYQKEDYHRLGPIFFEKPTIWYSAKRSEN